MEDIAVHRDPEGTQSILVDGRIIIHRPDSQWQREQNFPWCVRNLKMLMDSHPEGVAYITDMTNNPQISFTDMMVLASALARETPEGGAPLLKHPNLRIYVLVSTVKAQLYAANAMPNSEAFGYVAIVAFSTLEEAIAHLRGKGF